MDFLRIRQKARERALARERPETEPEPAAERPETEPAAPDTPPVVAQMGDDAVPAEPIDARDGEPERLEDRLRAELDANVPAALLEDPAPTSSPAPAAPEAADPLDDFFWREDESAPSLPELVAASALPAADPPEVRREWLTFRLGSEDYALEIQHVREVLKPPPLTEVPRAPAHILGVIMVRGEVVAVIDPRALLGLPRGDPGPRARILVCEARETVWGLLVDSVSHVVRLAPSSIEARPAGVGAIAADYIAGIGRERNRLFVLLDAAALVEPALPARAAGVAP